MVLIIGKTKISGYGFTPIKRSLFQVFGLSTTHARFCLAKVGLTLNSASSLFFFASYVKNRKKFAFYQFSRSLVLGEYFAHSYPYLIGKDFKRLLINARSRFIAIGSYASNRMSFRLPIHGQRTRSNHSTIKRFGKRILLSFTYYFNCSLIGKISALQVEVTGSRPVGSVMFFYHAIGFFSCSF